MRGAANRPVEISMPPSTRYPSVTVSVSAKDLEQGLAEWSDAGAIHLQ